MLEKMQHIANSSTRSQWESWDFYRATLVAFIDRQIKNSARQPKRVLILGAGNGNDVPIRYLERVSEEIVLVDIDSVALDNFLHRAVNRDKYKTLIVDLSGLIKELKNTNTYTLPVEERIKYLAGLKPKPGLENIPGNFDLVLNCNFATQLVAPYFMWGVNKSNTLLAELTANVEKLTGKIMREIFRQIYQRLTPGGLFVHLTDFLELKWNKLSGQTSPAVEPVMKEINHDWSNINSLKTKMDYFRSANLNICGSALPEYRDLFNLKDTEILRWNFSEDKAEKIIFIVLAYYFSAK